MPYMEFGSRDWVAQLCSLIEDGARGADLAAHT
jgi:hypothetical protein